MPFPFYHKCTAKSNEQKNLKNVILGLDLFGKNYIIYLADKILRNCVKVARQTLTLFVWVRILVPQPKAPVKTEAFLFVDFVGRVWYKKDVGSGGEVMYDIVAQAIGIIAAVLLIMSYQQRKQKNVILWQMAGQLLFTVNYLMLGITVGACLNALGFIRGIVYANREKFRAEKKIWVVVFISAALSVYALGFLAFGKEPTPFNLVMELLPVLAYAAVTIGFRATKSAASRRCGLVSSPLWLIYNITNVALGGVICEVFNLTSIIIGIIRLDIKRSKKDEF